MHVVKARTLEAKTKDKARILEAKSKAKARTLKVKAKAKDVIFCPRGSSRPRPVLEDYITGYVTRNVEGNRKNVSSKHNSC
jgi:hypothetical protein